MIFRLPAQCPRTSAPSPTRRRALGALAAWPALAVLGGCAQHAATPLGGPVRLEYLGAGVIRGGLDVDGLRIGGLSGIDYDAARDRWWLVCDDWSRNGPSRVFLARIGWNGSALDVAVERGMALRDRDGSPYARDTVDAEAIRVGREGRLWISSEGVRRTRAAPWVREFSTEGVLLRELEMPPMMRFERRRGPASNSVFEGLALEPDGAGVWVALEGPLRQDGDPPSVDTGAAVRFTRFDLATGRATAQFAYRVDPIPKAPILWLSDRTFADTGVSELLVLDARTLLVLERSYAVGRGVTVRLYAAEFDGASDTLGLASLDGAAYRPMRKTLVFDSDALPIAVDNLEGMSVGPRLPSGARLFVMCADDNFNPLQTTQLLAFALSPSTG